MSGVKCHWTFEDVDKINALRAEFHYLTELVRRIDQDEEFVLTPVSLVPPHIMEPFENIESIQLPFEDLDVRRITGESVPTSILESLDQMVNEKMHEYFLHILRKRIEVLRNNLRDTYAIEAVA